MLDHADPHARPRIAVARQAPAAGLSSDSAVAEVEAVLASIGDTCHECLDALC